MKKTISFLLAVLMLFSLLSSVAFADLPDFSSMTDDELQEAKAAIELELDSRKRAALAEGIDATEDVAFVISDTVFEVKPSILGGYNYYAIVEITNTGISDLYLDDCVFDIEDDNGHLIDTDDFISKAPDIISTGEKGYFYTNGANSLDDEFNPDNGANLVPNISVEKAKGKLTVYETVDTSLYENYGSVGVKGRVINNTDSDCSYLYVRVAFYDAEGKILGVTGTSVTDLKANSKSSFDISGMFLNDVTMADVAEYKIYANGTYMQF